MNDTTYEKVGKTREDGFWTSNLPTCVTQVAFEMNIIFLYTIPISTLKIQSNYIVS